MEKGLRHVIQLLLTVLTLTLVGCTENKVSHPRKEGGKESHAVQRVMAVYDYNPEEALQILDSAEEVGHVSSVWADSYRSRIYSWSIMGKTVDSLLHGPEGVRFDSARVIGERLLAHDSLKANIGLHQDVLEVLVYVARQQQDTALWLRRSRELAEVCRKQGAETEVLRTEAEIGAVLCNMGKRRQGMAQLDSVIALLDSRDPFHFNELDATIIALKRKIGVLQDEGKNVETISLARRIIDRLNDYELHPDEYHDGTYREPADSTQRADYIDFYRTQAQGTITAAYASLGEHGSMAETYEQIEHSVREASAREHLARYRALELQVLQAEAEKRTRLMTIIATLSVLALLLIMLFAAYSVVQNRKIRQKNRALVKLIEQSAHSPAEKTPQVDIHEEQPTAYDAQRAQFNEIDACIRTERLYANANIQRQDVCSRFNIRREVLNQLLADYADSHSFPAYINGLRLSEACRLLGSEPDKTVNAIADEVGLTPRNLRRLFVDHYGITPTEYRQGLQKS